MVRMTYFPEHDPLSKEYSAMMKALDAGVYHQPEEIWDLMEQLRAEGWHAQADRLGDYLPG